MPLVFRVLRRCLWDESIPCGGICDCCSIYEAMKGRGRIKLE